MDILTNRYIYRALKYSLQNMKHEDMNTKDTL
jgi:hypothetical protein